MTANLWRGMSAPLKGLLEQALALQPSSGVEELTAWLGGASDVHYVGPVSEVGGLGLSSVSRVWACLHPVWAIKSGSGEPSRQRLLLSRDPDSPWSARLAGLATLSVLRAASLTKEEALDAMESAAELWLDLLMDQAGNMLLSADKAEEDGDRILGKGDLLGLELRCGTSVVLAGKVAGNAVAAAEHLLLAGAASVCLLPSADYIPAYLNWRGRESGSFSPARFLVLSRAGRGEKESEETAEGSGVRSALRALLGTPDECREAVRVVLHLVEKALSRIGSGEAAERRMYTSEASVAAKVGPEVQGWAELLAVAGFERESLDEGPCLYFPSPHAEQSLRRASHILHACLGLPLNALVSLSELLKKDDEELGEVVRLLESLLSDLLSTGSSQFQSRVPAMLYHSSGVHGIIAATGLDKLWEKEGWVSVKTIRMELTRRKVEQSLLLLRALLPPVPRASERVTAPPKETETVAETTTATVTRLRDLDVTDLSGIDSDYGGALHSRAQSHFRSSQGGKYRRGRGGGKGGGCGGGGYASESESKLRGRRRGRGGEAAPSRGYHSEDEGRGDAAQGPEEGEEPSVEELLGPGLGTATVLAVETGPGDGPGDAVLSSPSPEPAPPLQPSPLSSQAQPLQALNRSPRRQGRGGRPKPPYRPPSAQFLVSQSLVSPSLASQGAQEAEADALRRAAQRVLYARPFIRPPPPATLFHQSIAPENIVVVPDSILHVSKDSECSDSSQGSSVPISQPFLHN